MSQKKSWSRQVIDNLDSQEQACIKFLKEVKNVHKWQQIANILNQNSDGVIRTAKECKNRYADHARFIGEDSEESKTSQWTLEQDQLLFHFFFNEGPKWNYISYHIPNKSQSAIKNRFYSSVKKAARLMSEVQRKFIAYQKNLVEYNMLLNVFDLGSQLQKQYPQIFDKMNEMFGLGDLKEKVLTYCFNQKQIDDVEVFNMVRRIRVLNTMTRSLGIFKIKNRKNWKLSEQGIKHLLACCEKYTHQIAKVKVKQE